MKRTLLLLIKVYQRHISSFHPPICRYHPSCSQYAYEAIDRYGLPRGSYLSIKRLLRCHPFSPGGYDPVK